ncbi:MAG: DUF302 domain-containing protein, partial [Sulfolobus sp.]|nr:DUF302 domain-containing protein [Sulfolobus sp.]
MLLSKKCLFSFDECISKLKEAIRKGGADIFAEIDHSENARRANLSLPRTVLLIFGNPAVGTLLMQRKREIGFDLPLRILIWEENGVTFLSYRIPSDIAKEYGIELLVLTKMDEFMNS